MIKKLLIISILLFVSTITLLTILFIQFKHKSDIMFIRVDKQKLTLSIITKNGDILRDFQVAVGTGLGNKIKKGDMKTPEGIFKVQEIADSKDWEYDFTDDSLGLVKGAYGPWFIRLDVPGQKGIGIHGTYDNTTIGKRISHGCIRMKNEDVDYLKKIVRIGTPVLITAGLKDYESDLIENAN